MQVNVKFAGLLGIHLCSASDQLNATQLKRVRIGVHLLSGAGARRRGVVSRVRPAQAFGFLHLGQLLRKAQRSGALSLGLQPLEVS